jgi:hypothetical protein
VGIRRRCFAHSSNRVRTEPVWGLPCVRPIGHRGE